ncbi:hypothetical protein [uncultured Thomasclavelia sp.]|uniref:hypothetical protein n=1 Tax=uncultured Thomasclavelia sp. TaxID=3025759 RepID=UPI0025939D37|nr:hypothetical protein [uncultured Thomasclavelia sp.]
MDFDLMKNAMFILVYEYHDTNVETFGNIDMLTLALANLKETFKNDNDFSFKIYYGADITEDIEVNK